MRAFDSFNLALNNILHRKLRAWLTLLGIIIGVAAVVSIISIGQGASVSISKQLSKFGADIITISPGFSKAGQMGGFKESNDHFSPDGGSSTKTVSSASSTTPELTQKDVIIIKGNPNILAVNEIVSGKNDFIYMSEKINARIQGINPVAWPITNELQLSSGRLLNPSDSSAIVIGYNIANKTFKQPITLGRTVIIGNQGFVVVGVLTQGNNDSTVFMNYKNAWEVTDVNKNTFSSIQAKAKDSNTMSDTVKQLTKSLLLSRKVTSKNQDFTITSSEAIKEQVQTMTQTLTIFLGAIAVISLIVGAIGVANSMFTSVLEKTKEIGIMKALGSTNNEILTIFLFESGLFGLIGGILGVGLGSLISFAISVLGQSMAQGNFTTVITPELIILAICLSTIIGIISGLAPASSASKMRPIDALRYE